MSGRRRCSRNINSSSSCCNGNSNSNSSRHVLSWALYALVVAMAASLASADNYAVAKGNKSLMVAIGCFWCGEQAFEQYAPGVVEAVSGYAGGINDNPTYRNHPGHYEVILIEYDPTKTSFEVLVNYAYRNMDPFDGNGQFCDKGSSYYPAIFYETPQELEVANEVLADILELKGWGEGDIEAPILERPVFWKAEDYHQDYYIKNPSNYGYYKNACKRTERLKQVWGLMDYTCYHDKEFACFLYDANPMEGDAFYSDNNITLVNVTDGVAAVVNANGEIVAAESNIKKVGPEVVGLLPKWAIITMAVLLPMLAGFVVLFVFTECRSHLQKTEKWKVTTMEEQQKQEQELEQQQQVQAHHEK